MLDAGEFEPFIRYIRFPYFRNLRPGTRIDFDHPVTVLVGPNGTNKTAVLRALQGCPGNNNLGRYWFSTKLDPILASDRHRFVYGYLAESIGAVVEVVKTRIQRPGDPDYFEPARPIVQDSMASMPPLGPPGETPPERTQTRWRTIGKDIVYIDFRSELSAYDKYFFHVPFTRSVRGLLEKKAFIRRSAGHLRKSIATRRASHVRYQIERIVDRATRLDDEQTSAASAILGREYEEIRMISHRYFGFNGASAMLKSADLRYSEAFAGSGEFAVVMLVKKIIEAPERCLILLDEPEVSLHPGAQRKLMRLLSEQAKRKRHQVVISTHSPEIVRDLPAKAIKVLQRNDADGKVELRSRESEPSEAFFRLGAPTGEKLTVFVEDELAAAVVKRAVRSLGEESNSRLDIVVLPGGAGTIRTSFIPNFALSDRRRCLVLLDGDQRPDGLVPEPREIADAALSTAVERLLDGAVRLPLDGSEGESATGQREEQNRKILHWAHANLAFLPGETPESLILDGDVQSLTSNDAKQEWVERTVKALDRKTWESVTADQILAEQERALAHVSPDRPWLREIRERVERFLREYP